MHRITPAQLEAAELQPDPIPNAWILAGAPQARTAELSRSPDGLHAAFLWDCTSGEYLWRYTAHETVEILEGEAMVDDGSGVRMLRTGDQIRFRAGAIARWRVLTYVKKISYCRYPRAHALWLSLGLARRLRSGASRGQADAGLLSRI